MRGAPPVPSDGAITLAVEGARGDHSVRFRVLGGRSDVAASVDVAVAVCLLPAMRTGGDLELGGIVSQRLLRGALTISDVFCTWDRALRPTNPWYAPIEVRADTGLAPASPERGTAAFFTGGVDSFFTVVTHREEIDALVFVHGFDVPLADQRLRREVSDRLRAAAAQLDLPLIEVETDVQDFGRSHGVPWPDYHGAALAAVAHVLGNRFATVLVPATHTYARLEGLGSHPLTDPLWSSEAVEIVHDGATATRTDKVRALAEVAAARDHLRVCWENRAGAYNCGRCEKCVRTGVAVRVAGAEGRFPTIEAPSLRTIAATVPTGRASSWHDLRNDLLATGDNPRLRAAIDVALARHQLGRWPGTRRLVR